MSKILMPKATAVWLIDNTVLTFDQVSAFCDLHILEVKGIADGDVAAGIRGADPIANGQITRAEIEKAEKNPSYNMVGVSFDATPGYIKQQKEKNGAVRAIRLCRAVKTVRTQLPGSCAIILKCLTRKFQS